MNISMQMDSSTKIKLALLWGLLLVALLIAFGKRTYKRLTHREEDHGTAVFATDSEIKKMGLLTRTGPVLGLTSDGRYLTYNAKGHISVIGPTRSCKGVGVIIPTLLSYEESVVVVDMKGENYARTAGYRSKFSRCYRFSPTMVESHKFNPLDSIRPGLHRIGDAQMIASIICGMDSDKLEMAHWQDTAWALLTTTILYVVEHYRDKSLAGMLTVLNNPRRPIREVLERMLQSPNEAVQLGARNLLNKHDNELSSVVSTASRHLMLYSDTVVAANTRVSDFSIYDLVNREQPLSVYLSIPPPDIERTAQLFRMIICLITKRLSETLEARKHKLLLIYDEFAAFGRIEYFEKALSYVAGYGIQVMLIAQSINQVRSVYGSMTSVLDQCECRVFMTPNDMVTATEISRMLGNKTIRRWRKSVTPTWKPLHIDKYSRSEGTFGRPLMLPEEVATMPDTDLLIKLAGRPPVYCKRLLFFQDSFFDDKKDLPLPKIARLSLVKDYPSEVEEELDEALDEKQSFASSNSDVMPRREFQELRLVKRDDAPL